jgi:hypothetical protein
MEGGFLTAAEFREVMRESTLRFERAMRALAADIRRDVEAHREESRRYFEAIRVQQLADRERLDEILAEGRAGRQALFRMLDRFDNGGGAAGAG